MDFRALRTDDRDQLQLHFDEENDEPALDLFIVKQAKIKKQGAISPLKPEKNMIFAVPDECSKGKGKEKRAKVACHVVPQQMTIVAPFEISIRYPS